MSILPHSQPYHFREVATTFGVSCDKAAKVAVISEELTLL